MLDFTVAHYKFTVAHYKCMVWEQSTPFPGLFKLIRPALMQLCHCCISRLAVHGLLSDLERNDGVRTFSSKRSERRSSDTRKLPRNGVHNDIVADWDDN
jgi:hypothetical protein